MVALLAQVPVVRVPLWQKRSLNYARINLLFIVMVKSLSAVTSSAIPLTSKRYSKTANAKQSLAVHKFRSCSSKEWGSTAASKIAVGGSVLRLQFEQCQIGIGGAEIGNGGRCQDRRLERAP